MNTNQELTNKLYSSTLNDTLEIIKDLLNYGKNFIIIVSKSKKIKKAADKILILWLRNIVELLDGILCLYKGQSFNNSKILARTLFEYYLNFKYAFEKDKDIDIRLRSYEYFNLITHLNEYNKMLKNPKYPSPNFNLKTLEKEHPPFKEVMNTIKKEITSNTYLDLYTNAKYFFKYQPDETYEYLFDKNPIKKPIQWYSLTNPQIRSISRLARHLNEKDLYIVFYKPYSNIIHAGDALNGLISNANKIELKNFDQPEEMTSSLYFIIALVVNIYDLYMKYFSLEDKKYTDKYSNVDEKLNNIFACWSMIEKIISN